MGFINRIKNVTGKKVKEAEQRYDAELRSAESQLDDELEEGDPALRAARERVRAAREQEKAAPPAAKKDDPPPSGRNPRSL